MNIQTDHMSEEKLVALVILFSQAMRIVSLLETQGRKRETPQMRHQKRATFHQKLMCEALNDIRETFFTIYL